MYFGDKATQAKQRNWELLKLKLVAWLSKIFFTVFSIFKVIVFQKSTEFELESAIRIPVVNS